MIDFDVTCDHGYRPDRCPDCAAIRIAKATHPITEIPSRGFLAGIRMDIRPTGGWPQPEPEHEWGELPDDMQPEDYSEPDDTADENEYDGEMHRQAWMEREGDG